MSELDYFWMPFPFLRSKSMPQPLPSAQQKHLCGRNFRIQFLERLCSSDPNAQIRLSSETGRLFLEEQLLKQKGDLDVPKLSKYTIRYSIPHKHRLEVWKLLLEISSPWPEARSVVMANRQRDALRIWTTLKRMLALFYEKQVLQTPTPRLIAMMVLLSGTDATIFDLQTTYFQSVEHKALLLISQQMSVIVKAGDTRYPWEDVYWLTSQFHARLASLDTPILGTMVEETMQALKGMQERLQEMYGEIESERIVREEDSPTPAVFSLSAGYSPRQLKEPEQIPTCLDALTPQHIELWFRSAGASWLSDEALFMLWDKLCAHDAVLAILKSVLHSIFGAIGTVSTQVYKKTDPSTLIQNTLPLSFQLQSVKTGLDKILTQANIPLDAPISMTY